MAIMENESGEKYAVRMYKLEDKTIIEIDGGNVNLDSAIVTLLSSCLGIAPQIKTMNLKQITKEQNCIPREKDYLENLVMTAGKYKGLTAAQALIEQKEIALVELFEQAKQMKDSKEKEAICKACKGYMATELEGRLSITGEEEITQFIHILSPLIDEDKLMHMFTYRNLEEFLVVAHYEEKLLAYQSIIKNLIQRGKA